MATRRIRVLAWIAVAGAAAAGTWVALPPAVTDMASGRTERAQEDRSVSIEGVERASVSYTVEGVGGDPSRIGRFDIAYTVAGTGNSSVTISRDFGNCDIPTGSKTILPTDEDGLRGSFSCYVHPPYWNSLANYTVVSPAVSVQFPDGMMRSMRARVHVTYPVGASVRILPEEQSVYGMGQTIWAATVTSCGPPVDPASTDTGKAQFLTCYSNAARVGRTVTIVDDPESQTLANWRMFLAGVLATAFASAVAAAVQEGTDRDSAESKPKAAHGAAPLVTPAIDETQATPATPKVPVGPLPEARAERAVRGGRRRDAAVPRRARIGRGRLRDAAVPRRARIGRGRRRYRS